MEAQTEETAGTNILGSGRMAALVNWKKDRVAEHKWSWSKYPEETGEESKARINSLTGSLQSFGFLPSDNRKLNSLT